jgi:NAD(P)-dependent dehydrogenase (short-subunit alcohol dehydrogenase family)
MHLAEKTTLVTVATSGIGEAIARAFAAEGARAVVTGRNAQRGRAVVESIDAASGAAVFFEADLTSRAAIDWLVAEASQVVGPLDILVNDAGIFPFDATERIDG